MARSKTVTARQRGRFLEALAEHRNATLAARAAGITRRAALDLKAGDPEFAAEWADSEQEATDLLEHEARQWAMHGVDVPVFYHGESKGATKLYSEELMLLFLRAERPEKFGAPEPGGRNKIERGGRKAAARAAANGAGTNGAAGNGAAEDGEQAAQPSYDELLVIPETEDLETWTRRVTEHHKRLAAGGHFDPG